VKTNGEPITVKLNPFGVLAHLMSLPVMLLETVTNSKLILMLLGPN